MGGEENTELGLKRREALQLLGAAAVTGSVPGLASAGGSRSADGASMETAWQQDATELGVEWAFNHTNSHYDTDTELDPGSAGMHQSDTDRTIERTITKTGHTLTYFGAYFEEDAGTDGMWVHRFVSSAFGAGLYEDESQTRPSESDPWRTESTTRQPGSWIKGTVFHVEHNDEPSLTLSAAHSPDSYLFFDEPTLRDRIRNNEERIADILAQRDADFSPEAIEVGSGDVEEAIENTEQAREDSRELLSNGKFALGTAATAAGTVTGAAAIAGVSLLSTPGTAVVTGVGLISYLVGLWEPVGNGPDRARNDPDNLHFHMPYFPDVGEWLNLDGDPPGGAGGGHSVMFEARLPPGESAEFDVRSEFAFPEPGQVSAGPRGLICMDPDHAAESDDCPEPDFQPKPAWGVTVESLPHPDEDPAVDDSHTGAASAASIRDEMEEKLVASWSVNVEEGGTIPAETELSGVMSVPNDTVSYSYWKLQDPDYETTTIANGEEMSHVISEPGEYALFLDVGWDRSGFDSPRTPLRREFEVVESILPTTSLPSDIEPGEEFEMSLILNDGNGDGEVAVDIDRYEWRVCLIDDPDDDVLSADCENPETVTTSEPTTLYAVEEAGRYSLDVTVYGANGATWETGSTFEVAEDGADEEGDGEGIKATITAMGSDHAAGEDVWFSAAGSTSSHGHVETYDWAFGDDQSDECTVSSIDYAQDSAPRCATTSHAYTEAGSYTVTLEVTDSAGNTATATTSVTVDEASDPGGATDETGNTGDSEEEPGDDPEEEPEGEEPEGEEPEEEEPEEEEPEEDPEEEEPIEEPEEEPTEEPEEETRDDDGLVDEITDPITGDDSGDDDGIIDEVTDPITNDDTNDGSQDGESALDDVTDTIGDAVDGITGGGGDSDDDSDDDGGLFGGWP